MDHELHRDSPLRATGDSPQELFKTMSPSVKQGRKRMMVHWPGECALSAFPCVLRDPWHLVANFTQRFYEHGPLSSQMSGHGCTQTSSFFRFVQRETSSVATTPRSGTWFCPRITSLWPQEGRCEHEAASTHVVIKRTSLIGNAGGGQGGHGQAVRL